MNFSEAMFHENYLTSHFKTCLPTHQDGIPWAFDPFAFPGVGDLIPMHKGWGTLASMSYDVSQCSVSIALALRKTNSISRNIGH